MANAPEEFPENPFDLLSDPEVMGFVWKKLGEEGLRELLAHDDSNNLFTQEWLRDVADELKAAGLRKAAGIVTEIAATKPSESDMANCPYLAEPYASTPGNEVNIRHWQMSQQRRQRERQARTKAGL